MSNVKSLWKCDDGTYDIVGPDGVEEQNVPMEVLAQAAELKRALEGLMAAMEAPRTRKATDAWMTARAALRRCDPGTA